MHSTTEADIAETAVGAVGGMTRSLYEALQSVPDKRCNRGQRYETGLVLTLLLLAKLAGESAVAGLRNG